MRPVRHTLIDHIRAPADRVFEVLTNPDRIAEWLPGCGAVQSDGPLRKGTRFRARFGARLTEFEIVDFHRPQTFGWAERGQRQSSKVFFRLDATGGGGATAVTIQEIWTPASVGGWVRGRLLPRRSPQRLLGAILKNLRELFPA